jgi:hypothetical protein
VKLLLCILFVLSILPPAHASGPGPTTKCAQVGNDDTIRLYDPLLRTGLLVAYARLFPQARMPPDERVFQVETHIRCMNGRLLACFTGANLPCGKLHAAPENAGAAAYCKTDPQALVVPAFAVGHDAAYAYRCVDGRPSITGATFRLDARGFAATLWAPLD